MWCHASDSATEYRKESSVNAVQLYLYIWLQTDANFERKMLGSERRNAFP